jgi:acetyl-CoA C-acetyltransferase
MRRVAIVGVAQVNPSPALLEMTPAHLAFSVTRKLLDETGARLEDIDNVVTATCDFVDGRSISNVYTTAGTGGHLREETKVEDDGAFAVAYAMMRIVAGSYDTAIVASYAKVSEAGPHPFSANIMDPFFQRPFGLDAVTAAGLQARRYMRKYGATEEDAALVVMKSRAHGSRNPYSLARDQVSMTDVMASAPIAHPVKELDAAVPADGACALILASEDRAYEITDDPVWIDGIGWAVDRYYLGHRDLAEADSAKAAAGRAYSMAGINDPGRDIDVAEISGQVSYHELMLMEALGLCEAGQAKVLVERGDTWFDGPMPVNPSGGPLCNSSGYVTGLTRVAEAALQLTGRAGERQVDMAGTAIAHGTSGICLQSNCVMVLRADGEEAAHV